VATIHYLPFAQSDQFLLDQIAHAEAQIQRLTHHMQELRQKLVNQGKTPLEADAELAEHSKPWRQFRKDYAFYHSLWARLLRTYSLTVPPPAAPPSLSTPAAKVTPIRIDQTGRNELCPCQSGRKYKLCCLDKPRAA